MNAADPNRNDRHGDSTGALARPLTRRAALGLSGAAGAAALTPVVWPGRLARAAQDPRGAPELVTGAAFTTDLFRSVAKAPYANRSISRQSVRRLGKQLVTEFDGPEDLAAAVRAFYSLSARSLEAVLAECRRLVASRAAEGEGARPVIPEGEVATAVSELNRFCADRYGLPFHRVTLSGKAKAIDRSKPAAKLAALSIEAAGLEAAEPAMPRMSAAAASQPTSAAAAPNCQSASYPRYVPCSYLPTKLQATTNQSIRYRTQDPSCNYNVNYPKVLAQWVGMSPGIYLVVLANAWGMKLAANDKALFIKAWTLAPYGFLPWMLTAVLWTRRA